MGSFGRSGTVPGPARGGPPLRGPARDRAPSPGRSAPLPGPLPRCSSSRPGPRATHRWWSASRAAGFPWPPRSPGRSAPRSTSWSCASSACPASPSWPWARSARTACGCSTPTSPAPASTPRTSSRSGPACAARARPPGAGLARDRRRGRVAGAHRRRRRRRHRHRCHRPGRRGGGCAAAAPTGSSWPCRSVRPGRRGPAARHRTRSSRCARPSSSTAVGAWYEDFSASARRGRAAPLLVASPPPRAGRRARDRGADSRRAAAGHRSPSPTTPRAWSLRPRQRAAAASARATGRWPRPLHAAGLRTLLFDLLTAVEDQDRWRVFDIALLAGGCRRDRLAGGLTALRDLPLGYFGASTGAGAALWAAADHPERRAPSSRAAAAPTSPAPAGRCARPHAAHGGGRDTDVLALNRAAPAQLRCPRRLEVVAGRDAPVRGARHPRAGGGRRRRLVPPPPRRLTPTSPPDPDAAAGHRVDSHPPGPAGTSAAGAPIA